MSSKSSKEQAQSQNSSHYGDQVLNQKFKERGFTAWTNMRLTPFDMHLNNVLDEILTGTNMKYLMQSVTGAKDDKFLTLDNLKPDVFQNRLKWCLKELEKNYIIPENVDIGVALLAAHNPTAIFDLLWRLVCHDIYFLWDRIGYLSNKKTDVLIKIPFTWVATKPAKIKNLNRLTSGRDTSNDMMSAMGATSVMSMVSEVESGEKGGQGEEDQKTKILKRQNIKFPGFDIMHTYNKHNLSGIEAPDPKICVIDMINMQLKSAAKEGTRRIRFRELNQLSDTRILCSIINSFIPNLFPTEVLVNDRWCLNLILRAIDKTVMCESTIDAEDLIEGDPQSICAFFCYLFMMLYKLKQSQAVVDKLKIFDENIRKIKTELKAEDIDPSYKTTLETKLHEMSFDLQNLEDKYDIKFYNKWNERVNSVKSEIQSAILDKLNTKFDWFTLDRDITVSNLCSNHGINLSLTNGVGFYKISERESVVPLERKIILKEKGESPKFFFNFTKPYRVITQILKLSMMSPIEINPENYQNLEIYVECQSGSKTLKSGTVFLYQVLPSDIGFYHSYLIKACQDKNLEAVKRLVGFFSKFKENFINLKEKETLNTALHTAAQNGYFLIIHYLLDNFADVNCKNKNEDTPLFLAATDLNFKECVKLLLEYGACVNIRNKKKLNIIQYVKSNDLRTYIETYIDRQKNIVPSLLKGNKQVIDQVIQDHMSSNFTLCSIRNRFAGGTTLLHLACKFDFPDIVERLLNTVDTDNSLLTPNIRDSKGRSPLHVTHDPEIIKTLINYGAQIESKDLEGNTPLHVMSYKGQINAIKLILSNGANLVSLNFQKYLPIHSAAIKGHLEVIKVLFAADKEKKIYENLEKFSKDNEVNSTVYLALKNDHQTCVKWLVQNNMVFKEGEADDLLHRILTDEIKVESKIEAITFLCQNGCNLQTRYQGGNTALHYAALTSGDIAPLELLIKFGAFVNIINDEMMSPLFNTVLSNNPEATALLIKHNADYKIRNNDGQTAFDFIKDIDEWMKCGCFDTKMKGILKSYEYKQTRVLIRNVTEKVKPDFSMTAKLFKRKREFSKYEHTHRENMSSYSTSIMLLPKQKMNQSQLTQSFRSND